MYVCTYTLHFPPTQLAKNQKKMTSNVSNKKYLNMYMCHVRTMVCK